MIAILAASIFVSVSVVALASSPSAPNGGGVLPDAPQPAFIGRPAILLGDSDQTQTIANRLAMSTADLTVTSDLGSLPKPGYGGIVFVDGAWAGTQSTEVLAEALAPLLMSGTPIALVNMTGEVIDAIGATQEEPFSAGQAIADGVETNMIGYHHDPIGGFNSVLMIGGGSAPAYFGAITELYEWGAMRA